jgi:hypothetical protein
LGSFGLRQAATSPPSPSKEGDESAVTVKMGEQGRGTLRWPGIADETEIVVKFQKRAHNPLLIAAGFDQTHTTIPGLRDKRLRLVFG